MRLLLSLLALAMPAAATAADFSRPSGAPDPAIVTVADRVIERPRRVAVVRTAYVPCVKCRAHGLPWGGLRKTATMELPWGGLPEACPPVRAVRQTVVVVKG
jgi:hypothetical protein